MRVGEATLHYFVNLDAEIFRGGHFVGEFLQGVQILVVEAGEHFPFDEAVEIDQVADHAGLFVDRAADGDFDDVVVAVSVGIVAFAVGVLILFGRTWLRCAGGATRRIDSGGRGGLSYSGLRNRQFPLATSRVDSLLLSVEIDKQVWGFVDADAVEFGAVEFGGEALPDGDGDILRGRNAM